MILCFSFSTLTETLKTMDFSTLTPFLPGQPENFAKFLDRALGIAWWRHRPQSALSRLEYSCKCGMGPLDWEQLDCIQIAIMTQHGLHRITVGLSMDNYILLRIVAVRSSYATFRFRQATNLYFFNYRQMLMPFIFGCLLPLAFGSLLSTPI